MHLLIAHGCCHEEIFEAKLTVTSHKDLKGHIKPSGLNKTLKDLIEPLRVL